MSSKKSRSAETARSRRVTRPPLTDAAGEVRELSAEDLRDFRPLSEVDPQLAGLARRRRGQRGPQKAPKKERLTLRLDAAVVEFFRATGQGWQTRINEALKQVVRDAS